MEVRGPYCHCEAAMNRVKFLEGSLCQPKQSQTSKILPVSPERLLRLFERLDQQLSSFSRRLAMTTTICYFSSGLTPENNAE